jgi:hypothetical protein
VIQEAKPLAQATQPLLMGLLHSSSAADSGGYTKNKALVDREGTRQIEHQPKNVERMREEAVETAD